MGALEESKGEQPVSYPEILEQGVISTLEALNTQLIEVRKQTKPPSDYPQKEEVAGFKETSAPAKLDSSPQRLHLSKLEGSLAFVSNANSLIRVNPVDGSQISVVHTTGAEKLGVTALASSDEAVFAAEMATGNFLVLSAADNSIVYESRCHAEAITAVSFAPKDLVAVSSTDGTWSLHNWREGQVLASCADSRCRRWS